MKNIKLNKIRKKINNLSIHSRNNLSNINKDGIDDIDDEFIDFTNLSWTTRAERMVFRIPPKEFKQEYKGGIISDNNVVGIIIDYMATVNSEAKPVYIYTFIGSSKEDGIKRLLGLTRHYSLLNGDTDKDIGHITGSYQEVIPSDIISGKYKVTTIFYTN
jgi:hypothetical protein